MYTPLPTPDEMAVWDQTSIQDYGLDGKMLMENASREALHVLLQEFGAVRGKSVLVFAGSGNNAGDGFALARQLNDLGAEVLVLRKRAAAEYAGAAAYHLQLATSTGVKSEPLFERDPKALPRADIYIDGLLGTGFRGKLNPEYQAWIKEINRLSQKDFVLALDIPSGINGWNGRPSPIAIKADVTVSFGFAKLGLALTPSQESAGRVCVRSIGLPARVIEQSPPSHFQLDPGVMSLYPRPARDSHKGQAGHVLVIGGSPGLTGAAQLSALAALRSGAGLVTIATPAKLAREVRYGTPDIMTQPLGAGQEWDRGKYEQLASMLGRFDSVVIGPGLGREQGSHDFFQAYMSQAHPRTVVDADGLYWLAEDECCRSGLDSNTILTPHPGEMARLKGIENSKVQEDRSSCLSSATQDLGCTIILKGANTLIQSPGQPIYVSPIACANLAVGGTGDILAGMLGSLCNKALTTLQACCLGVYWHGLAGYLLQEKYPFRGNRPLEIAETLPFVFKEIENDQSR